MFCSVHVSTCGWLCLICVFRYNQIQCLCLSWSRCYTVVNQRVPVTCIHMSGTVGKTHPMSPTELSTVTVKQQRKLVKVFFKKYIPKELNVSALCVMLRATHGHFCNSRHSRDNRGLWVCGAIPSCRNENSMRRGKQWSAAEGTSSLLCNYTASKRISTV